MVYCGTQFNRAVLNAAEVEYFIDDKALKDARRPGAVEMAGQRLRGMQVALGDRQWLVGSEFTIAALMMASVLKIARGLELLKDHKILVAYQDGCLGRPAYRKAAADQCATIERHEMADMHFDKVEKENA